MIENEVAILRIVNHPNIIQLIAEYDTPSELFLVMELVKVSPVSILFLFFTHGDFFREHSSIQVTSSTLRQFDFG